MKAAFASPLWALFSIAPIYEGSAPISATVFPSSRATQGVGVCFGSVVIFRSFRVQLSIDERIKHDSTCCKDKMNLISEIVNIYASKSKI